MVAKLLEEIWWWVLFSFIVRRFSIQSHVIFSTLYLEGFVVVWFNPQFMLGGDGVDSD